MEMQVSEIERDITCVRLRGRLDAPGAEAIGVQFTAATAARGRPTIVDLSEVSFVASMGLRLLIANARTLSTKGVSMILFAPQAMVREVFDQAALDQLLQIVATEGQALELAGC